MPGLHFYNEFRQCDKTSKVYRYRKVLLRRSRLVVIMMEDRI